MRRNDRHKELENEGTHWETTWEGFEIVHPAIQSEPKIFAWPQMNPDMQIRISQVQRKCQIVETYSILDFSLSLHFEALNENMLIESWQVYNQPYFPILFWNKENPWIKPGTYRVNFLHCTFLKEAGNFFQLRT